MKNISELTYPAALSTLNDSMAFSSSRGSYEIKASHLYKSGAEPQKVYLVALRGTDRSFDKTDVLGIPVVLKSSLSMENIYFDEVKKGIKENIPAKSDIVLIGHSLGGMIAQQIAADRDINDNYNLKMLVCIGSPFVKTKGRICPMRRFADKADVIPWLFRSIKANLVTEKPIFRSNGYFGKPVLAHTDSYRLSDSWRFFDCLGELNGGHVIVFDE